MANNNHDTKRKVSDLDGDEGFDFIVIATPLIEMLATSRLVRSLLFPDSDPEVVKAKMNLRNTKNANEIVAQQQSIVVDVVTQDIPVLLQMATGEKRQVFYQVIAMLDDTDVDTVKKYNIVVFIAKLKSLFKDEGFKGLFTTAA